MVLFSLSIYIRKISNVTTEIQRLKKKLRSLRLDSQDRELLQIGFITCVNRWYLVRYSHRIWYPVCRTTEKRSRSMSYQCFSCLTLSSEHLVGFSPRFLSCLFWFWSWTIMQYYVCWLARYPDTDLKRHGSVTLRHVVHWTCSSPRRPLFYTRSHLSALQNCATFLSTNFQFIFIFKKCTTQFSHWIV